MTETNLMAMICSVLTLLKLCGEPYEPLNLIFKFCIETDQYPSKWKKCNVVPVFKKSDKQLLKNYCPISLFPSLVKLLKSYFIIKCLSFLLEMV